MKYVHKDAKKKLAKPFKNIIGIARTKTPDKSTDENLTTFQDSNTHIKQNLL